MAQGLTFTVAEAIELARSLYPALTEALASDVFLGAWFNWAAQHVNVEWGVSGDGQSVALVGVAMLLAHKAYRLIPGLGAPSPGGAMGPVTSTSTLSLSASWGSPVPANVAPGDVELYTTQPGIDFLGLRDTRAVRYTPMIVGCW